MIRTAQHRFSWFLITVPITVLFFLILISFIGLPAIGGSSEAREAHVIQIIINSGDWILPQRNGLVPSKPPLFHWIAAAVARCWGTFNLIIPRMISALSACGVICLTIGLAMRFSKFLAASERKYSMHLGAAAGLILSTTYEFFRLAGDARVDMLFSFFVVLAIFSLLWPLTDFVSDKSVPITGRNFTLFYFACGLACLSKGPLGLALPVLIVGSCLTYLFGLRRAALTLLRPRLSWLLFLLIAVPWYLLASYQGSDAFVERQLIFENFQRFFGGDHINSQPFWFYLPSFLQRAFPWSVIFLAACLGAALKRWKRKRASFAARKEEKIMNLAAIWFVVGLLFLSLASGKRHSYLLPLFPGMSIYLCLALCRVINSFSEKDWLFWKTAVLTGNRYLMIIFFFLLCASSLLQLPLFPGLDIFQEGRNWLVPRVFRFQLGILITLALQFLLLKQKKWCLECNLIVLWAAVLFLSVASLQLGLGVKNHFKGFDRIAGQVSSRVGSHSDLRAVRARYDEYLDPLLFYLNRKVPLIITDFSKVPCPSGYLLATRRYFEKFEDLGHGKTPGIEFYGSFKQTADQYNGRSDRDIVLFTCQKGEAFG